MAFKLRDWQKDCVERFEQRIKEGQTSYVIEACMGAGKSTVAASIAKLLLEEYGIDHVLALVPWKSIQGDIDKGMLGEFSGRFGLDVRDRFFTLSRRQPHQPLPKIDGTITLYQEVCNQDAVETLKLWKERFGFRFALICDEIHHTNEINSTWGLYVGLIKELAEFFIAMSGTYFRSDKNPIGCIDRDTNGDPIKDYQYTYSMGVRDNVVRSVTTRDINATVSIFDKREDRRYDVALSEVDSKGELAVAKKQVLEPSGECIRHLIETAHEAMLRTRAKFPDAACLFVCRPGSGDEYTSEGRESIEDKHVHLIARQIKEITGESPTVVTHRDRDAVGKISRFRRATNMYLVAVNMVSEGCDIPRIRGVAFCRYTQSEMLFRQIVGRALRMQIDDSGMMREDGTAAQVYMPMFPRLVDFAERLYSEAQEGTRDRRCSTCGYSPCRCPCDNCHNYPCLCPKEPAEREELLLGLDAEPVSDGGHMANDPVGEDYVQRAFQLIHKEVAHIHMNVVQIGHLLQLHDRMLRPEAESVKINPLADRERLTRKINRLVRQLATHAYNRDYQEAWYREVQVPFKEKWSVMRNTWTVDQIRLVDDRLERRLLEVFRNG